MTSAATPALTARIGAGDTAWMLAAAALVLMMTPALGLFYAGLVRSKNTLNTFMMSVGALGVVTVTWAVVGYSIAFDKGNAIFGGLRYTFLNDVTFAPRAGTAIPHLLFMAFQATFCIVTAALVSGAVVERMRFGPFLVFMVLWSVLVYAVLAHWVFGGGWLAQHGTLDFAGSVPVEMGSGFSAFAAAIVVGTQRDYGRQALLPHNAVYALVGAGLLWFGWFGFNGGSGFSAGNSSVLAFTNTLLAPACALVVWSCSTCSAAGGSRRLAPPRRSSSAAWASRLRPASSARRRRPDGDPLHRLLRPALLEREGRTACCTGTRASSARRRWRWWWCRSTPLWSRS